MSYYQFNKKEVLQKQKAKKNQSKEIAAEYYLQNNEVIKKKIKNRYKNLADEEKQAKKEYQKIYYKKLKVYKHKPLLKLMKKKVAN